VIEKEQAERQARPSPVPSESTVGASNGASKYLPEDTETAASADSSAEIIYDYTDEFGGLLSQAVRKPGKKFVYRRPKGQAIKLAWADNEWKVDGWIYNLNGVRRVLYRLPEVLEAVRRGDTVWIAEGEKDADSLVAAGVTATTNPMGADNWRDDYSPVFRYANVVIARDNDPAGHRHARKVADSLRGIASNIKIVEAAEGKDATDHLTAGHGLGDFRTVETVASSATASSWQPVDLDAILDGEPEPPPSICMRDDGACLFYPGKTHWIQGESESLKTWLLLLAAQEQIALGNHVLYFDFEDSAKGVTGRLLALGCSRDAILKYFHYVHPDEPFTGKPETLTPSTPTGVRDLHGPLACRW
jgi:hypothetical protein